jgi:hypothetical protein
VSRLSRQCGILNISHPYRPPRPVTGIALLYTYNLSLCFFLSPWTTYFRPWNSPYQHLWFNCSDNGLFMFSLTVLQNRTSVLFGWVLTVMFFISFVSIWRLYCFGLGVSVHFVVQMKRKVSFHSLYEYRFPGRKSQIDPPSPSPSSSSVSPSNILPIISP